MDGHCAYQGARADTVGWQGPNCPQAVMPSLAKDQEQQSAQHPFRSRFWCLSRRRTRLLKMPTAFLQPCREWGGEKSGRRLGDGALGLRPTRLGGWAGLPSTTAAGRTLFPATPCETVWPTGRDFGSAGAGQAKPLPTRGKSASNMTAATGLTVAQPSYKADQHHPGHHRRGIILARRPARSAPS